MVFKDVRDVSWTNTRPCMWCFVFVFSSIVGIETADCHFLTCPFLMSGCTLKWVQAHSSWVSSSYWNLPGIPGMAGKNQCRWFLKRRCLLAHSCTGSWSCSNHHEHHFLSSLWWRDPVRLFYWTDRQWYLYHSIAKSVKRDIPAECLTKTWQSVSFLLVYYSLIHH